MKIAVTGKGGVGKTTFADNTCKTDTQMREKKSLRRMWIRMRTWVLPLEF